MKLAKLKKRKNPRGTIAPTFHIGAIPISAQAALKLRVEQKLRKTVAPATMTKQNTRQDHYLSAVLVFVGKKFQRVVEAPNLVMNKTGLLAITIKKQPFELFVSADYAWIDTSQTKLPKGAFKKIELQPAHLTRLPRPELNLPSLETLVKTTSDDAAKKRLKSLEAGLTRVRKVKHESSTFRTFAKARQGDTPTFSTKDIQARLPSYDASQLLQTWKNALRIRARNNFASANVAQITKIIEMVEYEWSTRDYTQMSGSFAWPTTDAPKSSNLLGTLDLGDEGMLAYLEYRVGWTRGLPSSERKSILERVFEGKLPGVFAASYMAEWGGPSSPRRLQKMAECIAAFSRNAKRRDDDRLDQAIREWEDDLQHLFDKYYIGHFHFTWPNTTIG